MENKALEQKDLTEEDDESTFEIAKRQNVTPFFYLFY